jgi:hypothetical protein
VDRGRRRRRRALPGRRLAGHPRRLPRDGRADRLLRRAARRRSRPILAPILGAVGLTLVTVSHLIPIALANELVPAYTEASGPTQESLAGSFQTLTSIALVTNDAGNFLGWGVAVPMFAYAILKTAVVARWIGWLGMVVAVFAGWLGLLFGRMSAVIKGISSVGFLAFFIFMLSMGIALLRRRGQPTAKVGRADPTAIARGGGR